MRVRAAMPAILAVALCAPNVLAQGPQLPIPAAKLVREVVYNELHDHAQHGYWRYWVRERSPNGTRLKEQVETEDGPVARLARLNGQPLSAEQQQAEQQRLDHLLVSPNARARHLRQYDENEERIGHVVAMLPNAFLYEYAGEADGCYRLKFRPNPAYSAHDTEARIFHAMTGMLWVDAQHKRLARLYGRFEDNVDFGFGILGRVYKGGWFRLERVQVSPGEWKTSLLDVHVNVRALLVKKFARRTSERRGGFVPVPAGLTLAQGLSLLEQTQALNASAKGAEGDTQ